MGMSASTVGWGTALSSGLPIEMKNIGKAKHASDTGVYDAQGNVDPKRFEAMFKAADKDGDGKLTVDELADMRKGNKARDAGTVSFMRSLFSAFESQGEFGVFMDVAGKPNGPKGEKVLTKDQVFKLYNGTLFQEIADQVAASKR
jgi:peroxygenase